MSAAEFEAYTTGKTLYFKENGQAYGAERYLPGRQVEWSFLDGRCKMGQWYPEGPAICFTYEDTSDPQCWIFDRQGNRLKAEFVGQGTDQGGGTVLYEAEQTDEPMYCMGPDTGV